MGVEAIDVARLTGLPLMHARRSRQWEPPDVDVAAAARAVAEGLWDAGDVIMDLTRLEWGERLKVAWARIGAYYYQSIHCTEAQWYS